MTCIFIDTRDIRAVVCVNSTYKLRLSDGSSVFMEWHNYCGPDFYRDRHLRRHIDDWWENPLIGDALDWFVGRGKRA